MSTPTHLGTALAIPEPGEDAIIRRLKRYLLLFDNIAVLHLSNFIAFLSEAGHDPQLQAELEWLLKLGLLTPVHKRFEDCLENPFQEAAARYPKALDFALEYAGFYSYLQIQAFQLTRLRQDDAVLVFSRARPSLDPIGPAKTRSAALASTLGVIFEALPQPDD